MSQGKSSKGRIVFRPVVVLAGLSVLIVLILSALHEVSAPSLFADEADAAATGLEVTKPEATKAEVVKSSVVQMAAAETETKAPEAKTEREFRENVMGAADAPVTIIEYSSMTCPHCASFHKGTLPELKKKYVDTGKARYVLREFPLDNLAAAAFMLARCVDEDKYFPFVDMLYAKQRQWTRDTKDPIASLRELTKQAGFTEERFNSCIRDQEMLNHITKVRADGHQKYGVRSTPTFIINGKKLEGAQDIEAFDKAIEPLLKEAGKS